MTKVSSISLCHNLRGGWSSVDGLSYKLFHEQVGHNGANGGTHGYTMYLILKLEEEIGIFELKFQQCDNVVYGHRGSVMWLCVLLQLMFDYGDGMVHRNR